MSEKNYAVLRIQKLKSAGACQNVLNHMRRQGKELHHLTNPEEKNYRLSYTDSYPKDITYGDMTGIDNIYEKERLLLKWKY